MVAGSPLLASLEKRQALISLAALAIALGALFVSVASFAQQGVPQQDIVSRIARYGVSFQAPPIVAEGFRLCLSPNAPAAEAVRVFLKNTANVNETVRAVVYVKYYDGQQERVLRLVQDITLGPGGQYGYEFRERFNFTNNMIIPLEQIRSVDVVLLKLR